MAHGTHREMGSQVGQGLVAATADSSSVTRQAVVVAMFESETWTRMRGVARARRRLYDGLPAPPPAKV